MKTTRISFILSPKKLLVNPFRNNLDLLDGQSPPGCTPFSHRTPHRANGPHHRLPTRRKPTLPTQNDPVPPPRHPRRDPPVRVTIMTKHVCHTIHYHLGFSRLDKSSISLYVCLTLFLSTSPTLNPAFFLHSSSRNQPPGRPFY